MLYCIPGIPGPDIGGIIAGAGREGVIAEGATRLQAQLILAVLCTQENRILLSYHFPLIVEEVFSLE
jgi:hypothetical protein